MVEFTSKGPSFERADAERLNNFSFWELVELNTGNVHRVCLKGVWDDLEVALIVHRHVAVLQTIRKSSLGIR